MRKGTPLLQSLINDHAQYSLILKFKIVFDIVQKKKNTYKNATTRTGSNDFKTK